jgi:hypothetical protein
MYLCAFESVKRLGRKRAHVLNKMRLENAGFVDASNDHFDNGILRNGIEGGGEGCKLVKGPGKTSQRCRAGPAASLRSHLCACAGHNSVTGAYGVRVGEGAGMLPFQSARVPIVRSGQAALRRHARCAQRTPRAPLNPAGDQHGHVRIRVTDSYPVQGNPITRAPFAIPGAISSTISQALSVSP